MTEYIAKESGERGALMLEAIALLGLMTMMSPMVVRQTADRTAEMEEVAVAGQMKTLRDAVSSYIESNYANIASWAGDQQEVSLEDLRPYLPASFFRAAADGGSATIGNKLVDNYRIGVRRERPCADLTKDECNRYKITGLISSTGDELDERRAARIATMIGADGGFVHSAAGAAAAGDAATKVIGAQGIWEIADAATFLNNIGTGRVVATTSYSSGIGGDFLYRHAVNGLPDANSMFTDIDMSGMGTEAHRIRHSGGLEVVNGKIIVRSSRNNDWNAAAPTTISATELTTTDANVSMTKGTSAFNLIDGVISVGVGGTSGTSRFYARQGSVELSTRNGVISSGTGGITLSTSQDIVQNATGDIESTASGTMDMQSTGAMKLTSTSGAVNIKGGTGTSNGINLTTSCTSTTGTSSFCYGLYMRSDSAAWTNAGSAKNRMIGGLNLYSSSAVCYNQADCSPFSLSSASNKNGNNVYMAVSNYFNDHKGLILHSSTNKNASHQDFQGIDMWSGGAHRGDRSYSADVHLGTIGSGADNEQNGGRLQLGAHERMRVNLQGRATGGGFMEMYSAKTKSDTPVLSAVIGASQAVNGNSTGGVFALGTGYTDALSVRNGATNQSNKDAVFYMNARTGDANMPYFAPYKIALKENPESADDYGYAVRRAVYANWNDTGDAAQLSLSPKNSATITEQLRDSSGFAVRDSYGSASTITETVDGKTVTYDRYVVDPAFVSVMNDIKLTSRGGAHLADILPNYVNKGIYVLSNTYAAGPWPCTSGTNTNCNYVIPRLKKTDGGAITSGAWENDCTEMNKYMKSPARCSPLTNNGLRVNYYSSSYVSCDANAACLTHPYLGAVPAPGRSITIGGETLSAYDEGPCPTGYVPVMTVTPTAFEVGKVNHIDMRVSKGTATDDDYVYYNLENIDFDSNRASIYQPATAISTAVRTINSSGGEASVANNDTVIGWQVALGTVSTASSSMSSDGYTWNQGGVWQDSMKAVVHTYCYFNPTRFWFPNMIIDKKILKATPAPRLVDNATFSNSF